MLQYGRYVDNSKDFSGVKMGKMSIYVHVCCSTGDIFLLQKMKKINLPELKKYSMYTSGIFYVHRFFFNSGRCPKT